MNKLVIEKYCKNNIAIANETMVPIVPGALGDSPE